MLTERKRLQIKVFYTWEKSADGVFDIKFNQHLKWDIPLLDGYDYQFVKNISEDQGTHHFKGMINPGLNKEIEDWGANAILIFGWNFDSHFKAMRYFKGKIPVYFRGDSTLLDEKPGFKTFARRIWLKFVYHFIDFALFVGENNKNYYLKHGLREKQLIYAPHAIDNERFSDSDETYSGKAQKWKNELGILDDDLVFLFAGKFESKKNPALFIHAANYLKNSKLKFILAGDGILKEELKLLAKNNQNIIFLPFQNQTQMPVLYRLCHVLVLPSKGPGETWGLAVNEAMACSKAILVSDKTGCATNLVKIDENGFIFKSGDLNDFVNKIKRYNSENCTKFGNNSKRMIKGYSFELLCEAIELAIN
jgi:glycosyltransferase involved in cell wall biosynthesis